MAESKKKCGPHVELSSNDATRVSRCGCGTVHVHLVKRGLTVQLDADTLRKATNALTAALRLVEMVDDPPPPSTQIN